MGAAIRLAVELAGLAIPLDSDFFQRRQLYLAEVHSKAGFTCNSSTNRP